MGQKEVHAWRTGGCETDKSQPAVVELPDTNLFLFAAKIQAAFPASQRSAVQ